MPSNVALDHRCRIDCLAKDCSNSSALAMELLQFCAKPSILLINFSITKSYPNHHQSSEATALNQDHVSRQNNKPQ